MCLYTTFFQYELFKLWCFIKLTEITEDERLTADEMDSKRSQAIAYEYLCHLEEAKQFVLYIL